VFLSSYEGTTARLNEDMFSYCAPVHGPNPFGELAEGTVADEGPPQLERKVENLERLVAEHALRAPPPVSSLNLGAR